MPKFRVYVEIKPEEYEKIIEAKDDEEAIEKFINEIYDMLEQNNESEEHLFWKAVKVQQIE
jgi:PII-like signaling protein